MFRYSNSKCFFYVIFSIFSYIIIPISFFILKNTNFKIQSLDFFPGFPFVLFLPSIVIYSAIICIIFSIIFSFLIFFKRFHPFVFIFPFFVIFLCTNYSLLNYFDISEVISSGFYSSLIKFFVHMNFMFLPFSYIPFVILFTFFSFSMYIKQLSKKINSFYING